MFNHGFTRQNVTRSGTCDRFFPDYSKQTALYESSQSSYPSRPAKTSRNAQVLHCEDLFRVLWYGHRSKVHPTTEKQWYEQHLPNGAAAAGSGPRTRRRNPPPQFARTAAATARRQRPSTSRRPAEGVRRVTGADVRRPTFPARRAGPGVRGRTAGPWPANHTRRRDARKRAQGIRAGRDISGPVGENPACVLDGPDRRHVPGARAPARHRRRAGLRWAPTV